jgi:hypothetical protein
LAGYCKDEICAFPRQYGGSHGLRKAPSFSFDAKRRRFGSARSVGSGLASTREFIARVPPYVKKFTKKSPLFDFGLATPRSAGVVNRREAPAFRYGAKRRSFIFTRRETPAFRFGAKRRSFYLARSAGILVWREAPAFVSTRSVCVRLCAKRQR